MRKHLLLFVVTVIWGISTLGAWASSPNAIGWWWQAQSSALPFKVPPPPGVPPDGLFVASDPGGARAISALRFQIPIGERASTITLRVASSSGTPVLGACVATSDWKPASSGAWEERPTFDCQAGSAMGTLDNAGKTATFAATVLARGVMLDLVVLPGGTTPSAFQVAFENPGDESLSLSEALPPPPVTVSFTPALGSLYQPPPIALPPVAGSPETAESPLAAEAGGSQFPNLAGPATREPVDDTAIRVAGAIVLVVLLSTYLFLGAPLRTLLVRFGLRRRAGEAAVSVPEVPAARGVGRFRQPRDALVRPPPL